MVTVVKDNDERVIGYIEWRLVGPSGFDVQNGEYIYINYFWITPDLRGDKTIFRRLVSQILRKGLSAKFGYFNRKKYGGKMKMYPRQFFEDIANKGVL